MFKFVQGLLILTSATGGRKAAVRDDAVYRSVFPSNSVASVPNAPAYAEPVSLFDSDSDSGEPPRCGEEQPYCRFELESKQCQCLSQQEEREMMLRKSPQPHISRTGNKCTGPNGRWETSKPAKSKECEDGACTRQCSGDFRRGKEVYDHVRDTQRSDPRAWSIKADRGKAQVFTDSTEVTPPGDQQLYRGTQGSPRVKLSHSLARSTQPAGKGTGATPRGGESIPTRLMYNEPWQH